MNEDYMNNMSDEEVDELLDSIVESIGEQLLEEDEQPKMLNFAQMDRIRFCHAVMKALTVNMDARVTYKLQKPFKSMGSVTVECKEFACNNALWFSRMAEFADNTEIYPLTDGNIRMTMTFHNLTVPVE